MCWDIISLTYHVKSTGLEKQSAVDEINRFIAKLNCAFDHDIMMNRDYQALVLTDAHQEILWVDKGFTEMTGYPRKYAVGKHPSFLQGANTSLVTRQKIRRLLTTGLPFKEVVVNYRKDSTEYRCEVEIIPIKDHQNQVQAYLAFEREVA